MRDPIRLSHMEAPRGSHSHTPDVCSDVLACRNYRPNQVASGEAMDSLGAWHVRPREPEPVRAGSLIAPTPGGLGEDDAARIRTHAFGYA
ncbi:MAG: hypothetical protein ACYCST_09860, partial [Acidimicrobiales bacterium]